MFIAVSLTCFIFPYGAYHSWTHCILVDLFVIYLLLLYSEFYENRNLLLFIAVPISLRIMSGT